MKSPLNFFAKTITLVCSCSILLLSCTFSKISKCTLVNQNDYPIEVTLITNNVQQNLGVVRASDTLIKEYEWTDLKKEDGAYRFVVKNMKTQETLNFIDAMYVGGELSNYIDAIFVGETIQLRASN